MVSRPPVSALEQTAMSRFFCARQFAVIGASTDRSKFGNHVLRWYIDRHMPVTPVHPKQESIEGIRAVKELKEATEQAPNKFEALTGVSIITPPSITKMILEKYAQESQIEGFWLQPGAADGIVVKWIQEQPEEVQSKIVYSGPCVLVEGDKLARSCGRL